MQVEAEKEAQAAVDLSPSCALCHTILVYSVGPYLNKFICTPAELAKAHSSSAQALELIAAAPGGYTAKERGVIEAFALRHAARDIAHNESAQEAAIVAFSESMCDLAAALGTDADTFVWCAESLMLMQRFRRLPYAYYNDAYLLRGIIDSQHISNETPSFHLNFKTRPGIHSKQTKHSVLVMFGLNCVFPTSIQFVRGKDSLLGKCTTKSKFNYPFPGAGTARRRRRRRGPRRRSIRR